MLHITALPFCCTGFQLPCYSQGQERDIGIVAKYLCWLYSLTELPLMLLKPYLTPNMPLRAMAVIQAELSNFIIVPYIYSAEFTADWESWVSI